ncbi:MAG: tripartite tricarboxylate transporter substrate binding protein [Candidatus Protistobacter heckmanni]|nr:tripartite tricarboxylate transporter substrate binding protein [Candidatus Protistobacter heckmanni]
MSDSIQNKRRSLIKACLAADAVAGTGAAPMLARAADFPSQPLRMQAAFPAGGPTDVVMRVLADNASKVFGQPVVVENRPCAGGTLPAQALQTAKPDGYTVGQTPLGIFRLPYTTKITWDPVKDLSYIICVTGYSFGIVVPTSSPIQTWADYVAYAKANPGKLSYGSTGTLTSPHLTVEDIAQRSGITLNHIPYKGSTELMQAVLGGHVMSASNSTGFAPHVASGKLRVLNTWGEKRLTKFPDAPTLKELGLPIVQTSPYGLAAPKGTDPAIVKRLHDGFKQAMDMQSYHDVLAKYDQELIYMNSAQYTKFAEETFRREKALIEKLGLNKPA